MIAFVKLVKRLIFYDVCLWSSSYLLGQLLKHFQGLYRVWTENSALFATENLVLLSSLALPKYPTLQLLPGINLRKVRRLCSHHASYVLVGTHVAVVGAKDHDPIWIS